jgi:hypothetical protein
MFALDGTKTTRGDTMRIETAVITPKMAVDLLTKNDRNRTVKRHHVSRLAMEMLGGRWLFNATPIQVCVDGMLIDGQHRLLAIIEAGVPVKMVIAYDVPAAVMNVIDQGSKRSGGDVLSMHGHKNATKLAAAANWVEAYRSGSQHLTNFARMSSTELVAWMERDGGVVASIAVAKRGYPVVPISAGAAMHYLMSKVDKVHADLAFDILSGDCVMGNGHPWMQCRERMYRLAGTRGATKSALSIEAMIYAWNLCRAGATVKKFRVYGRNIRIDGSNS